MRDEHHSKTTLRPCDCTCICGDDRDVERGIAEPCEARKASEALTAKAVERSERIAALIKAGGYKPGFDFLDALEALSSRSVDLVSALATIERMVIDDCEVNQRSCFEAELRKQTWSTARDLNRRDFPTSDRIGEYCDTTIERMWRIWLTASNQGSSHG